MYLEGFETKSNATNALVTLQGTLVGFVMILSPTEQCKFGVFNMLFK